MRLIFADDTSEPITAADATNLMTQVNDWYVEKSYDTLSITSDITPLLMMPQDKNWYQLGSPRTLLDHARAAAAEMGYNTNEYDLDITRFTPIPGLNFSGSAITQGKGLWLQSSHPGVVIHEIGHNLGLQHASFWTASADSVIGPGTHLEYGNIFDVMGTPPDDPEPFHFNACWLAQLGWLGNVTVNTSGTYRLHAFDTPNLTPGATYALRIRKDQGRDYWAEFRQKFTANPWTRNGILLNWSPWQNSRFNTHLLDTTPGSPTASDSKEDAALVVGRTLSDSQAGVHITPLAVGESVVDRWIDVQVHLGSFSNNAAPGLILSAGQSNVDTGQQVQLTASATDADGDLLAYHWDFGDLSLGSNSPVMVKSWTAPGDYPVQCTVTDMKGGIAIRTAVIRVGSPLTFQVSGRILDSLGMPLAGVRVHNNGAASAYRGVYTDSDGNYSLVDLPAGNHELAAVRYGYNFLPEGWANPVTVGPDASELHWTGSLYPPVSVVATDTSATESEQGTDTATFVISRSGSLAVPVSVKFTLGGTAELFDDYTLSAGGSTVPYTVLLPAGVATTNITLTPGDEFEREGTESVTLTLLDDIGYIVTTNAATVTITDSIGGILPYIQWENPAEIIYGTPLGAQQLNAFTFDQGMLTYDPRAGTLLNAGEAQQLAVVFTPDDPLRYESATNYVTINVAKKALTVTADDVTTVHGAPIVLTASYNGFVNGDTTADLDIPASITTDATSSSPIGSYPITVFGASDANYSVSFVSGNLTITRAATTGVLTSSSNPAPRGQAVTFTFTVGAVAPSTAIPVGTVRFSVDGTSVSAPLVNGVAIYSTSDLSPGSHSVSADYLGTPNFFPTINTLAPDQMIYIPVVITWPTPADITYGAALGMSELNALSSAPGTFTYNPPAGTVLNAGSSQVLSVTFTPSDPHHEVKSANVAINVLKKSLIITANNQSKVYGAALPFLSITYNGFVNGDRIGGLDTPAVATTVATAASDVGSYPVNVAGASDSNYQISFVNGTLAITPAALTITAINQSMVYGSAIPGLSLSHTGFVNGDTRADLDTPALVTTAATAASPVGTYPIIVGGAADSNYTVTFVNGTLTVTPASVLGIVTSSSNPAVPGQQVTFTFTASPAPPSSAIPTGNVLVKVDGESTAVPLVNGVATFSTSTLSIGSHVVEAEYAGNANWIGTTNRLSPDQLVNVPSPQLAITPLGDGSYRISFDGVSGVTYRIDFSSADLTAWQTLGNATPEGGGSFELIDTPPPSSRQRFYRVVYP
jgi:hypothetical protein